MFVPSCKDICADRDVTSSRCRPSPVQLPRLPLSPYATPVCYLCYLLFYVYISNYVKVRVYLSEELFYTHCSLMYFFFTYVFEFLIRYYVYSAILLVSTHSESYVTVCSQGAHSCRTQVVHTECMSSINYLLTSPALANNINSAAIMLVTPDSYM